MRTADQTFPDLEWADPRRALRLPPPEVHRLAVGDGVVLRLVRYKGGDAGPVVFAPGNGVSNKIALLDTIGTNLAEYLVERGRDVWLFDWRCSPDVDCPGFSLHDAARYDWPDAARYVIAASGASRIDCVAFCAGGITLLAALASGRMAGLVRSAVLLQASLAFDVPWLARLKARVHLATIVETLGWRTYRQDAADPSWPYRLLDGALHLHPLPHGERCNSPSCRRMAFSYGPVVRHANVNAATHDRLPVLYGRASLRSLRDLSAAVRDGEIVPIDAAALDNLCLPLTFVHGDENTVLQPGSARRLQDALAARNGAALYQMAITPGYRHFDCLAGDRCAEDVFSVIGAHLDRWSRMSGAPAFGEIPRPVPPIADGGTRDDTGAGLSGVPMPGSSMERWFDMPGGPK